MNTILATVTSRYNLPSCWLYEDRQYQIEGEIKYKLQMKLRNLPWVETEHEGILQEQGISYRKVTTQYSEYLEYWDKDFYETEDICLPLYAKVVNVYKYTGKNHTGNILTLDTVKRACELEMVVMNKISEQKAEREAKMLHDAWYAYAEKALEANIYTVTWANEKDFPYQAASMTNENLELKKADNHFKVLVTRDSRDRKVSCYGIFDMEKIAHGGYLTLFVPKNMVGYVIGKGGCNKKRWEKELGVKKITVVGV